MARVMPEHGRLPQGQQPTLAVPRLPWVGGSSGTPGRAPGWVGCHHPVGLWVASQTRLLRLLFYGAEAVPGELSRGCSSPEVSCEGTWLSVCPGLPAEGHTAQTLQDQPVPVPSQGGQPLAGKCCLPSSFGAEHMSKINEPKRTVRCLPVHCARRVSSTPTFTCCCRGIVILLFKKEKKY